MFSHLFHTIIFLVHSQFLSGMLYCDSSDITWPGGHTTLKYSLSLIGITAELSHENWKGTIYICYSVLCIRQACIRVADSSALCVHQVCARRTCVRCASGHQCAPGVHWVYARHALGCVPGVLRHITKLPKIQPTNEPNCFRAVLLLSCYMMHLLGPDLIAWSACWSVTPDFHYSIIISGCKGCGVMLERSW
jgi:hypothetical protein